MREHWRNRLATKSRLVKQSKAASRPSKCTSCGVFVQQHKKERKKRKKETAMASNILAGQKKKNISNMFQPLRIVLLRYHYTKQFKAKKGRW